jgi:hypothetical protein
VTLEEEMLSELSPAEIKLIILQHQNNLLNYVRKRNWDDHIFENSN